MQDQYILAIDQGTTSSRAIVFNGAGAVRAMAQREFRQIFPRPGWVEHDPLEIWDTQLAVAREALAQARLKARDIAAIGIANQRETTVLIVLSPSADAFNNREVDLRLEEPFPGTTQIVTYKTHSLKLQKPFTSDFE